jgi:nitrogen fixation protein NifU and related proteins
MLLESMYQEIILDHYKNPHHRGLAEDYDAEAHHVNPTCGDEVTVRVRLSTADGAAVVEEVTHQGLGCSISQASSSVMSDLVTGHRLDDALVTQEEFLTLMQSRGEPVEIDEDRLEDAVAFSGVAKYPARVKCALLGWMAFKDAASRALAAHGQHQAAQGQDGTGEAQ